MKSLTYGQLPEFNEFRNAFTAAVNDGLFHFTCSENDARMFEATGIERLYRLDAAQLYALCEALVEIANGEHGGETCETCDDSGYVWPIGDEGEGSSMCDCPDENCNAVGQLNDHAATEWAGEFASSILTTLGFEWI